MGFLRPSLDQSLEVGPTYSFNSTETLGPVTFNSTELAHRRFFLLTFEFAQTRFDDQTEKHRV